MLWASWYAQQLELGRARQDSELDRKIAEARAREALGVLPYLLGCGAQLDAREARWALGTARANEAVELAGGIGHANFRAWGLICLAWIEAAQGIADDCRSHTADALDLARAADARAREVYGFSAVGLLELGLGNIPAAVEQLEQCARLAGECGLGHPNVVRYEPDLVEALCAAGRNQDAHYALGCCSSAPSEFAHRGGPRPPPAAGAFSPNRTPAKNTFSLR